MRRIALVLLTCLGLTLTIAGPAGAARFKLSPLSVTSIQAVAVAGDPTQCAIQLAWTTAAPAPKGTTFVEYFVPASPDPNADWGSLSGTVFTQTSGTFSFLLPNDDNTWYFNVAAWYITVKGKQHIVSTPYAEPASVVVSC